MTPSPSLNRRIRVIEAQACTALEQSHALLTTLCAAEAARHALLAAGAPAAESWVRPVLAALELLPPALQPLLQALKSSGKSTLNCIDFPYPKRQQA